MVVGGFVEGESGRRVGRGGGVVGRSAEEGQVGVVRSRQRVCGRGRPHQRPDPLSSNVEELWDNRRRYLCKTLAFSTCFLFGGREILDPLVGDYGDVSRALADYFKDGGRLI